MRMECDSSLGEQRARSNTTLHCWRTRMHWGTKLFWPRLLTGLEDIRMLQAVFQPSIESVPNHCLNLCDLRGGALIIRMMVITWAQRPAVRPRPTVIQAESTLYDDSGFGYSHYYAMSMSPFTDKRRARLSSATGTFRDRVDSFKAVSRQVVHQ